MKVRIKNVGLIENCEMDIEDISVIVGKNASGKSTIGKVIFSILHSISDSQKNVYEEELDKFLSKNLDDILRLIATHLDDKNTNYIKLMNRSVIKKNWEEILFILKEFKEENKDLDNLKLNEIFGKISMMQNFVESDYSSKGSKKRILKRIFEEEFGTLVKLGKEYSEISLDDLNIKYESEKISMDFDEKKKYLYNDAVLIESPIILNIFDRKNVNFIGYSHNSYLMKTLTEKSEEDGLFKDIENKKTDRIEDKIKKIISGNLYYDSKTMEIKFEDNLKRELKLSDLAAGVKSLGLLLMVLRKIKGNTVLILDEPEVHLHPEWQFVLAEIISLISKEMGIKILIATHSSLFLEALELNGRKYGLNNNYYYCENAEVIKVLPENMNEAYKKVNGNIYDMLDRLNLEIEAD